MTDKLDPRDFRADDATFADMVAADMMARLMSEPQFELEARRAAVLSYEAADALVHARCERAAEPAERKPPAWLPGPGEVQEIDQMRGYVEAWAVHVDRLLMNHGTAKGVSKRAARIAAAVRLAAAKSDEAGE